MAVLVADLCWYVRGTERRTRILDNYEDVYAVLSANM